MAEFSIYLHNPTGRHLAASFFKMLVTELQAYYKLINTIVSCILSTLSNEATNQLLLQCEYFCRTYQEG